MYLINIYLKNPGKKNFFMFEQNLGYYSMFLLNINED